MTFILTPIITSENPGFQKNLNITRHLSPMSAVKVIKFISKENVPDNPLLKFQDQRRNVIKAAFDDTIIYADSFSIISSDKIVYYQKNLTKEISMNDLTEKNEIVVIKSKTFLLGTDEFGRDVFTRLVYGLRISVLVGIGAVLITFLIGISLGFIAGFKNSWIDTVLNRFTELFLSFPAIYLVVLMLALFSSSLFSVILVLGVSGWMSLFKIVRGEVAALKQKDYIQTAKLLGLKSHQILFREILPVIIAPVVVNLIFQFSNVILAESALSYLGLSNGIDYPSWGSMIQSGQEYINKAWWMILFPGISLVITLLAANDFGRKVNKLLNPRLDL
jgi:peptide/nickel transport system permease protein